MYTYIWDFFGGQCWYNYAMDVTSQVHEMSQHDGAELKGPLDLAPMAGAAW